MSKKSTENTKSCTPNNQPVVKRREVALNKMRESCAKSYKDSGLGIIPGMMPRSIPRQRTLRRGICRTRPFL